MARKRYTTSRIDDVHAFDANGLLVHNCGEQPLAGLRLLLPRLDRPDALRRRAVRARRALSTTTRFVEVVKVAMRMLDNVLDVTVWPLPQQQRRGARTSAASAWASPAWATRWSMLEPALRHRRRARARRARIAEVMRDAAYDASVDLARERGAFPLFNADLYLSARQLRVAPAAAAEGQHPRAGPAQLAPAVDRAHRHHQPGVCRQRQQRHRAGVQLELHAQEARARRQLQGVRGRRPRLAAVPAPEGRRRAADRRLRHRARDERARRTRRWWPRWRRSSTPRSARPSTCRPTIRTPTSRTCTSTAWKSGLKGLATYRPNAVLGSVLSVERRKATPPQLVASRRRQPAPARSSACRRRCWRRCAGRAGPTCPAATRPGAT